MRLFNETNGGSSKEMVNDIYCNTIYSTELCIFAIQIHSKIQIGKNSAQILIPYLFFAISK